ncbi:DUF1963 domain-containing protein [Mangrovivirga sp. M17]|uniref:DUF1963 domain-containing protein n=1 Tax=Mangrovivirga halotolerans TaxID=2993936 RepID=A0ABT3RNB8_9BACT|nr:DUF1963 domain-containing protein [Mangrovivirga halotolerans]MCX2743303.1 DUF1963 domain-containing protein [Mangrovivirga halotolerans]
MNVEEIRKQIAKPATKFLTGGFRPQNSLEESWIGKVFTYQEEEGIPVDQNGNLMIPLAQLSLAELPYVPPIIESTKLLTVFISEDFPEEFEPMGNNWLIREYQDLNGIQLKGLVNENTLVKPFPLKPEFVEDDYPLWDGGGLSSEMEDEVLELENLGVIESYYDIINHSYEHKIGGYPSFCQSGVDFGDHFEFVFQISSDQKANFNVVDNGSLMFSKNQITGEWNIYYDFY